jgi:hypothetical protein
VLRYTYTACLPCFLPPYFECPEDRGSKLLCNVGNALRTSSLNPKWSSSLTVCTERIVVCFAASGPCCANGVSYLASLGLLCPKPGVGVRTVSQERSCCRPGDRLGGVRFPRGTEIFLPFRVILPVIWPTKLHIRQLKRDSSRN